MQRPQTLTNPLHNIWKSLRASDYIKITEDARGQVQDVKLLENGRILCTLLDQQWFHKATSIPTLELADIGCSDRASTRTSFVASAQFRHHLNTMRMEKNLTMPAACKVRLATLSPDSFLKFVPSLKGSSYLVTDSFYPHAKGLERFYNIQRERKIWWMRLSTNPSRYCVDPFDLSQNGDEFTEASKSVTIKSELPYGTAEMEHLTLVQLQNSCLRDNEVYHLRGAGPQPETPAIIRSVIDLQAATCAMLFDASDHKRSDTLLLNRKLVPYQCHILTVYEDDVSEDLRDLTRHLQIELKAAGLRVLETPRAFVSTHGNLADEFYKADALGLPYILLVDANTLQQGLLKLRSRDTTLSETIHISDIPGYLLDIFKHQ